MGTTVLDVVRAKGTEMQYCIELCPDRTIVKLSLCSLRLQQYGIKRVPSRHRPKCLLKPSKCLRKLVNGSIF